MLTIPQLTEKMIAFSAGNTADIHHFLCVWAYAKTIGEAEGLDEKTQFLLEATESFTIFPVRFVGKNTAIRTASIKRRKALGWCKASLRTADLMQR